MSFEEKGTWIYAVLAVALPPIYFVAVLGQLSTTAVSEIDYQRPLLTAIGAAIGLAILATIVVAIASPREAGKSDQRDKDINRLGEHVAGIILAAGMVLPFGMTMLEFEHFWIANAMYLAFVLSAFCGAAVKLVAYRRGF